MLRIVNHRIAGVEFRGANSCGGFLRDATVIVCHDTAAVRPGSSVEWFANPECTVSAHVVVERDGTATQMVPFDQVAYHAGQSSWGGRSGVNGFGIGIEIMNPGMMERRGDEAVLVYPDGRIVARFPISECREVNTPEHGHGWCLPYTPEQIATVQEICLALVKAYPSLREIVTHWLIAPRRKVDTTPLFPLADLRTAVFEPGMETLVSGAAPVGMHEAAHVVAEPGAVAAPKASMFDGLTFAHLNQLADQGSRIAQALQRFKRWLWAGGAGGTIAAGTMDTSRGTGGVVSTLVQQHPLLSIGIVVAICVLLAILGLKIIEKYLVTAAKDGRYGPRGSTQ